MPGLVAADEKKKKLRPKLLIIVISEVEEGLGESTRLQPMWPGFDSQTNIYILVLQSAQRGFSPGTQVFPSLLKKQPTICN